MRGVSLKLCCLAFVLVAFTSFLSPYTAEARHKRKHHKNCHRPVKPFPISPTQAPTTPPSPSPTPTPTQAPNEGYPPYEFNGCGYPCSDSNDCDWPCTVCCGNQTCCYDEPFIYTSPPSPSPSPIFVEQPTPELAPTLAPTYNDLEIPPTPTPTYQTHDCGYPCSDSNDCDWPCTLCCWQNQTCCHEEPFFILPSPSPSPLPLIVAAPTPTDGEEVPPYQPYGCGYPCSDSNDCDWPCTLCCANQTCCYEDSTSTIFPQPSSPPLTFPQPSSPSPSPSPSPPPSNDDKEEETDDDDDDELAPQPSYQADVSAPQPSSYYENPTYRGCGYGPCMDSNDCDWPCTRCCANQTCCYEQVWPPMFG
ncbi:Helicase SWR1 [Bienertia sinuspersici]